MCDKMAVAMVPWLLWSGLKYDLTRPETPVPCPRAFEIGSRRAKNSDDGGNGKAPVESTR